MVFRISYFLAFLLILSPLYGSAEIVTPAEEGEFPEFSFSYGAKEHFTRPDLPEGTAHMAFTSGVFKSR